jgi:hypothetical protein
MNEYVLEPFDQIEAILRQVPSTISNELRTTHQIFPFSVLPDNQTLVFFGIVDDMYNIIGVKTDKRGKVIVAIEWGDTPSSIFSQSDMPQSCKCISEYFPNGLLVKQEFIVNGEIASLPVPLEQLIRNCRNSLDIRINPPINF